VVKRIFIFEDFDPFRLLLRRIFESLSPEYEIVEAADVDAAKSVLEGSAARPPDLILLDWLMPPANGHSLLVEIRSRQKFEHVPIVVLTGAEPEQLKGAYEDGASAVIEKGTFEETVSSLKSITKCWIERCPAT
jgi:CheY-like chemotaxis protein